MLSAVIGLLIGGAFHHRVWARGRVPARAEQAQSPQGKASPPSLAAPLPADQEQFISYWTTEAGWDTEIQLRNNQASAALTVTPAFRSADGVEAPLQPVVVQPQEVKIIDLATSGASLLGAYGSVVLRYRAPDEASLFSMARSRAPK